MDPDLFYDHHVPDHARDRGVMRLLHPQLNDGKARYIYPDYRVWSSFCPSVAVFPWALKSGEERVLLVVAHSL